jgi:hypothetical protein
MREPIRIRDLDPGESFVTLHTHRHGIRLSEEPPEGGKGGVEVSLSSLNGEDVEDKTLHDDVKVLPWKGVVH